MAKTAMKSYSLTEMKDKYIGKKGTKDRDQYEYELRMDVLGRMIKTAKQKTSSSFQTHHPYPLKSVRENHDNFQDFPHADIDYL